MRKDSFILPTKIAFGVFVIVPLAVFAQVVSASTTRQQIIEDRKEVRQEIEEDRKELRIQAGEKLRTMQRDIQIEREALKTEIKGLTKEEVKKRIEEFRIKSREKREEVRVEIKSEREEFHKKATERREELKKKIGEERAKQVEEYFTRMMNRMDAAIDRLDKLTDRLQSRLDKIKDSGKDITEPQSALDTARVSIAGAHTAISDAKIKFAELVKSNTPKESFFTIKEIVSSVKTKLKEAHAALVEVINSIKKGRLDIINANTTSETQ